jgi:hypothetical protein
MVIIMTIKNYHLFKYIIFPLKFEIRIKISFFVADFKVVSDCII